MTSITNRKTRERRMRVDRPDYGPVPDSWLLSPVGNEDVRPSEEAKTLFCAACFGVALCVVFGLCEVVKSMFGG